MSSGKMHWFRYHWEDVNGIVPTPDNDFWEYQHMYVQEDINPYDVAQKWADAMMGSHEATIGCRRQVFWELIECPQQKYIQNRIVEAQNNIRRAQKELDFYNEYLEEK